MKQWKRVLGLILTIALFLGGIQFSSLNVSAKEKEIPPTTEIFYMDGADGDGWYMPVWDDTIQGFDYQHITNFDDYDFAILGSVSLYIKPGMAVTDDLLQFVPSLGVGNVSISVAPEVTGALKLGDPSLLDPSHDLTDEELYFKYHTFVDLFINLFYKG